MSFASEYQTSSKRTRRRRIGSDRSKRKPALPCTGRAVFKLSAWDPRRLERAMGPRAGPLGRIQILWREAGKVGMLVHINLQ